MSRNKQANREAMRERCREALRNLYHNATPVYPRCESDAESRACESWFQGAAEFEIEYLQSGGAYGSNYQKTLRADCNAGHYKSQAARDYYVRKGMRAMHEERERYALWECASDYGRIYQYGRGGRTLAPSDLVRNRGGFGWGIAEDYGDDLPYADCVWLCRVIESFNRHVESWCKSVPEQWREQWAQIRAEREAEANEHD